MPNLPCHFCHNVALLQGMDGALGRTFNAGNATPGTVLFAGLTSPCLRLARTRLGIRPRRNGVGPRKNKAGCPMKAALSPQKRRGTEAER